MKKILVIGLIALGAAATSYGQGFIIFDNYDSQPYMPIVYGDVPLGNPSVSDPNVHADLLFTLGTAASTDLGLSVPIDPTAVDSLPAANHGYFKGGIVTIPGYVSGPVTFEVEAWQTAGPEGGATFAQSQFRGTSAAWTESSLATTGLPANFFANLPGPNGAPLLALIDINTPEPSVFALSGIGLSALILNRRRARRSAAKTERNKFEFISEPRRSHI
jgi:hypothetical protein